MVTWIDALAKTRNRLSGALSRVFQKADEADRTPIEELEESLIASDVSARLANEWMEALDRAYGAMRESRMTTLRRLLIHALGVSPTFHWNHENPPLSILVTGVNGSGKTTTCAKLARRVVGDGGKPLLVAADTFRAAGTDQLSIWAERVGCDIVSGTRGADAASVAYDGLDAAIARKADVVIVDTAGRMHTQQPLMNELAKVGRAMDKRKSGAPEENWIVLDASIGRNAVSQASQFHRIRPLTGAVIAKLDGTAKAGFVFSITQELGIPIRFVGLGEGPDDLVPFDPEAFVSGLLGADTIAKDA